MALAPWQAADDLGAGTMTLKETRVRLRQLLESECHDCDCGHCEDIEDYAEELLIMLDDMDAGRKAP